MILEHMTENTKYYNAYLDELEIEYFENMIFFNDLSELLKIQF